MAASVTELLDVHDRRFPEVPAFDLTNFGKQDTYYYTTGYSGH